MRVVAGMVLLCYVCMSGANHGPSIFKATSTYPFGNTPYGIPYGQKPYKKLYKIQKYQPVYILPPQLIGKSF